jgi:flagellar basal-body rod modification protein FlgD
VVRREAGALKAGEHAFAWDGKDQTGQTLPEGGIYTLRVAAKDALGSTMTPATTVEGVVRAVEQANGEVRLMLNGVGVPLSAVLTLKQAT